MLTFRVPGLAQSWEIRHGAEAFRVTVTRQVARRGAAHRFLVGGPASFVFAERPDAEGITWLRVEHAGESMRLRACYAASSTSSRLIVAFDADKAWAITMVRPADVASPSEVDP